MSDRVVVFLDWQNVYEGARESFHTPSSPGDHGQVSPLRLAEHLASQVPDGHLKQVRIYRGLPSNAKDPRGYGAVRKQTAAWMNADPQRTYVYLRPLQYLDGMDPREKGIDVRLAIDYSVMAVRGEYDVGILFSTDTDLKPALDVVYQVNGAARPWPRVAGWSGPNHRQRCITASTPQRKVPCCWGEHAVVHGPAGPQPLLTKKPRQCRRKRPDGGEQWTKYAHTLSGRASGMTDYSL